MEKPRQTPSLKSPIPPLSPELQALVDRFIEESRNVAPEIVEAFFPNKELKPNPVGFRDLATEAALDARNEAEELERQRMAILEREAIENSSAPPRGSIGGARVSTPFGEPDIPQRLVQVPISPRNRQRRRIGDQAFAAERGPQRYELVPDLPQPQSVEEAIISGIRGRQARNQIIMSPEMFAEQLNQIRDPQTAWDFVQARVLRRSLTVEQGRDLYQRWLAMHRHRPQEREQAPRTLNPSYNGL